MENYPKSYKGFIVWLILFVAALMLTGMIPTEDVHLIVLLIGNIMTVGMAVLTGMIWFNQKIYWYTGLSYEEACKASPEQRKTYARRHFVRFGVWAVLFLLYSLAAYFLGFPFGVSIAVMTVGTLTMALSTIRIAL